MTFERVAIIGLGLLGALEHLALAQLERRGDVAVGLLGLLLRRGHDALGLVVRGGADGRGLLLVADLHQAQQRVVGVLAHEFGIDGNEFTLRETFTQRGEGFGIRDQRMDLHM